MDEAREQQQQLTAQQKRSLANWISQVKTEGNPVPDTYIKETVEEIMRTRAEEIQKLLRPIGGRVFFFFGKISENKNIEGN